MLFMRYLVCEPEADPFATGLAPMEAPGPGLVLSARPVATSARQLAYWPLHGSRTFTQRVSTWYKACSCIWGYFDAFPHPPNIV